MHRTKISAEFEFGVLAGVCNPQKCGILLSWCMTQSVNKAMPISKTSHRTQRPH